MIQVEVDTTGAIAQIQGAELAFQDARKPLGFFGRYMANQIMAQIKASNVATGGDSRDTRWSPYKPQYTRADGTTIEAWGGVQKVRGQGDVKGRRRHNRSLVAQGDTFFAAVKNAGSLVRRRVTATSTDATLTIAPTAGFTSAQDAMRPFLFFQAGKDLGVLEGIFERWLARQMGQA